MSRRWFAPEVVQTSAMDCGPASLTSLLAGFGVHAQYSHLRDLCQTDVDGTSIDTIEELACQLGLDAEQIMIPVDHVLRSEARALPGLAVVRLADGTPHFVVIWRRHGAMVQVMDPAKGRVWIPVPRLLDMLHVHAMPVSGADWREWAGTEDFLGPLRQRLRSHGLSRRAVTRFLTAALEDPSWRGLATLDAAARFLDVLGQGGARLGAARSRAFIEAQLRSATTPGNITDDPTPFREIPRECWTVWPSEPGEGDEDAVVLQGAVLIKVAGRRSEARPEGAPSPQLTETIPEPMAAASVVARPAEPGSEAAAGSWRTLLRLARQDGLFAPMALAVAAGLASLGILGEALLFRASFDLVQDLGVVEQRLAATFVLVAFLGMLLVVEFPLQAGWFRLGRRFEARVRDAIFAKIPRLKDRYFRSRVASDLAERAHAVHLLRQLPTLGGQALRAGFSLIFTVAGVVWLDPASAWIAVPLGVVTLLLPLLANPFLSARDLAFRTHGGALANYHLDALRGLVPLRTHGAEAAMRRNHHDRLRSWQSAGLQFVRAAVWVTGVQALLGFAGAAFLLYGHLSRGAEIGAVLLLVYWVLSIPVLAEHFAAVLQQIPQQRNVAFRVLEMLTVRAESIEPEQAWGWEYQRPSDSVALEQTRGVDIDFRDVTVEVQGQPILGGVNVRIVAGEHVAIVGPSGAGKSSLVGLLLGWHRPTGGNLRVDGQPLNEARLRELRHHTAWLDPAITLWNRSLADNLRYGADSRALDLGHAVRQADLRGVLQRLPEGLQTSLGEEGGLVSGGEGQRVRLGRALGKNSVRLAILDEPFRGLDRATRQRLLRVARQHWRHATMFCVTHDLKETRDFDRVLVVDGGRVVEDGVPAQLLAQSDSRYGRLLEIEETVQRKVWSATRWRRLWMEDGRLTAGGPPP